VAVAAKHVHRRCRVFDAKIRAHRDMRLEFGPHTIADGREEIERSTPKEVSQRRTGVALQLIIAVGSLLVGALWPAGMSAQQVNHLARVQ
jgi:hypothetical protein